MQAAPSAYAMPANTYHTAVVATRLQQPLYPITTLVADVIQQSLQYRSATGYTACPKPLRPTSTTYPPNQVMINKAYIA